MFFYADLVSETHKGTWFCCLDPRRRASPAGRTTRYSVFKERPRSRKFVKNFPRRSTKIPNETQTKKAYLLLHYYLLPIYTLIYDPDASESNRVGAGGIGTLRESPRDGRRNLRETRLRVKRHSIGPRRFFSTRGEIDRFSESRPNIDSGKTSFSDLNQDFARLENPCGIGLALAFQ